MAAKWLDYLRDNEDALQNFLEWLDDRKAQHQEAQDEAATWDAAKEALGAKKSLDQIKTYVKVNIQEEKAHVAYLKSTRPKSA